MTRSLPGPAVVGLGAQRLDQRREPRLRAALVAVHQDGPGQPAQHRVVGRADQEGPADHDRVLGRIRARAQHMVAAAGQDGQVTRGETLHRAVLEGQLARASGNDVHTTQVRPVEVEPEPAAQFEPPVGGALEAELPEDGAQQIHGWTNDVVRRTFTHGLSGQRRPSV
jgi:hypothetical protein